MLKKYPIVIHKDPNSDYGVTVPDLPGCFTAGDTLDDAINQSVEAIECHIAGLLLDGEDIPEPKNIKFYKEKPDYAGGEWKLASVNFSDVQCYSVVIHENSDGVYEVNVPDLPGCSVAGSTLDDTLTQAVIAIEDHIGGLLSNKKQVPKPKDIASYQGALIDGEGEWKSVAVNLKSLREKHERKPAVGLLNSLRQIIDFSTPRLLPYAAGLLVLIGGLYLGSRYFDGGVDGGVFDNKNGVVPVQVEPTFVKGIGKDVKISLFGFGALPDIPTDFPDQNVWDVVGERSVRDPDGAKTLELLARVRIKLWEEGKHTKGVIMDPSSGLVYSDSGIEMLFPTSPDLPKYDTYFDEDFVPSEGIVVKFLEDGIDPYKFLNLRR